MGLRSADRSLLFHHLTQGELGYLDAWLSPSEKRLHASKLAPAARPLFRIRSYGVVGSG